MPFKPTWNESAQFVCPETGVFVKVTNTNHKVPQWSIAGFGRYKLLDNGKQVPVNYILVRAVQDDILSGELNWSYYDALMDQLEEAAKFIEAEHKLNCKRAREMEAEKNQSNNEKVSEPRNLTKVFKGRRQTLKTEQDGPLLDYREDSPESAAA